MKEILKKLGFKHMTGPLWEHEQIGVISISEDDEPNDLALKIQSIGYGKCQKMIRSNLGIKD